MGYAAILFEISFGEARHLSRQGRGAKAQRTFDLLFRFIFFGWAIYPLGYMTSQDNLLVGLRRFLNVDVIYNLGDAVNKIGFGLVVWNLARAGERQAAAGLPPEGTPGAGSSLVEPTA